MTPPMENSTDRTGRGGKYAVLKKTGRVLVLVNPSAKALRRRGKRGWELVAAADFQSEALHLFEKTFDQVVAEAGADKPAKRKKSKNKGQPQPLAV